MLQNDFIERQERIMVISAHPDDAEIYAGGTIALARRHGIPVWINILTDGSIGTDNSEDRAELSKIRYTEQTEASEILNCLHQFLWFRDAMIEPNIENRIKIVDAIRIVKPSLILTHRLTSGHPDHRATAQLVIDAIPLCDKKNVGGAAPCDKKPVVMLFWDEMPPAFNPKLVVELDPDIMQVKQNAVNAHASQRKNYEPDYPKRQARSWSYQYGGSPDAPEFVEAFELSPYGVQP